MENRVSNMKDFLDAMAARVANGLQRKSITRPSRWASTCRVMGEPYPGKWNFLHHPWLREMHDSESEINVGQKSAQMGFTEAVLNLTFYNIDVKRVDCLYVLPSKVPDATDFSSGRFDRALELSPHLSTIFSDVQNVGHKRAGTANMYIRGSHSRSHLKSVPVGFIVLDEVDEMDKDNIQLAFERVSGQVSWAIWMISTPTYPDVGINKYFNETTQDHFMFKCPSCSKLTELIFPDCLEIVGENTTDPRIEETHLKCKECKAKLHHETKTEWLADGTWVPSFSNRPKRGFHVNQLYSMTNACRPATIAASYFTSLHDPSAETELYNSKLGLPHAVKGSQLDEEDFKNCIGDYSNATLRPRGLITMGVDVGKWFHCVICEWHLGRQIGADFNTEAFCRVLNITKVQDITNLDLLMQQWNVHACVIDRNPEPRTALQFANKFYGRVRCCMYGHGIAGKEVNISKTEEHLVLVDRTSWFDLSLNRFRRGKDSITIPYDTPEEYKAQLKVLARIYRKDKDGNQVGYYENFDKDDHYAHAQNYAEIALKFAGTFRKHSNIGSPV